jgi:hypothetical protein
LSSPIWFVCFQKTYPSLLENITCGSKRYPYILKRKTWRLKKSPTNNISAIFVFILSALKMAMAMEVVNIHESRRGSYLGLELL